MAFTYNNSPVLSKIKIGEQTYWLKDAELRAIVDAFKGAVNYNVDTTFDASAENLATEKAIAAWLETQIAGLSGAMHFVGVVDSLDDIATPKAGDVAIVGTKEYVYGGDPAEWKELGDEGTHASQSWVTANYVAKTATIAGIDLADNITVAELQAALQLKALAYKDSASGTVTTADSITGAKYTPAGSVAVTLNQTSTAIESKGTYKPAGSISNAKVTAAGSVSIAKSDDGVAVSGTVSTPTITVTPNTATVQHIDSLGTLPSYTAAQYTAPSVVEAKSKFAAEGIVAAIDGSDAEMLVFSAASKADALTGTGFNAGSYTAAEFNAGALPSLGAEQTVVTGIASATSSAITFTGDKFGATFSGTEVEATGAAFSGTEAEISVNGNYDKAGVESAGFTGTEATITPTLVTSAKTVTVQ